jgi:hypothetical protein
MQEIHKELDDFFLLFVLVKPDAFVCTNKLKVQLTHLFKNVYNFIYEGSINRGLFDRAIMIRCKLSRNVDKKKRRKKSSNSL